MKILQSFYAKNSPLKESAKHLYLYKKQSPKGGIYELRMRMTKPELEFMEIDMGFSSKRMRHLSQERCALILKLNQSTTSCHISS